MPESTEMPFWVQKLGDDLLAAVERGDSLMICIPRRHAWHVDPEIAELLNIHVVGGQP